MLIRRIRVQGFIISSMLILSRYLPIFLWGVLRWAASMLILTVRVLSMLILRVRVQGYLYLRSIKALFRHYSGSIEALLRLLEAEGVSGKRSMLALLRPY